MKSPNEIRADIDVLNIEFGDAELFDRNAAFDAQFEAADRRAAGRVLAIVLVMTIVPIALIVVQRLVA